jgi:hypothetical protein
MKRNVNADCADCGGAMEEGSVVDFRRNNAAAGEWVAGDVMSSAWTGSIRNDERFVMTAYRCGECGLLKMYARKPATGSKWT